MTASIDDDRIDLLARGSVEITDVTKRYGTMVAVDRLNLTVRAGDVEARVALFGREHERSFTRRLQRELHEDGASAVGPNHTPHRKLPRAENLRIASHRGESLA